LRPLRADGAATSPATVQAACDLASGQDPRLASVAVSAASPSPTPSASSRSRSAGQRVKFPKGCGDIKVVGNGTATCGYITGFSDVEKLYGAAELQPKAPKLPALV